MFQFTAEVENKTVLNYMYEPRLKSFLNLKNNKNSVKASHYTIKSQNCSIQYTDLFVIFKLLILKVESDK